MPATLQEIRETFTLAGGGSVLTPKLIDRLLNELQRQISPMKRAFPTKTWETDTFYFNKRTALPQSQFTTEAPPTSGVGSVAPSNSTYAQSAFPVKHTQSNLDISTFSAKVATVNGNLYDLELAGGAKSMQWLEETTHMYGSAQATLNTKRPQWDGADLQMAPGNKVDAGTTVVTLNLLDNAIDSVIEAYAEDLGDNYFFALSTRMLSTINRLFVNQQRFDALMGKMLMKARTDLGDPNAAVYDNAIDAGVEVQTYRGIPLVRSTFLSNRGSMTTVTATGNTGTGSSFTAGNIFYYVVEAVTRYGITAASAEVNPTVAGNGNNVVLTWTTPQPLDKNGNIIDILGYRVHRGTATGAESLYAVVSAYDLSDNAVLSFTDTGLPQIPAQNAALYWTTVATSGSNAASDGVTFPRVQTGTQIVEDIWLMPRDPEILVIPEVNPIQTVMLAPVNARTRQFALTSDKTLAMRAPAFAAKISRVRVQ